MITLNHDKGNNNYWLSKGIAKQLSQKFSGVIDHCDKKELLSLARKINKKFEKEVRQGTRLITNKE